MKKKINLEGKTTMTSKQSKITEASAEQKPKYSPNRLIERDIHMKEIKRLLEVCRNQMFTISSLLGHGKKISPLVACQFVAASAMCGTASDIIRTGDGDQFIHDREILDWIDHSRNAMPFEEEPKERKRDKKFLQACIKGDLKEMSRLADKGAKLLGFDNCVLSYLFTEATEANLDVVKLLLEKGADPVEISKWAATANNKEALELCFEHAKTR